MRDPGTDNYETTVPVALSPWTGSKINIAFLYYAKGSGLTSTILRIDNITLSD